MESEDFQKTLESDPCHYFDILYVDYDYIILYSMISGHSMVIVFLYSALWFLSEYECLTILILQFSAYMGVSQNRVTNDS